MAIRKLRLKVGGRKHRTQIEASQERVDDARQKIIDLRDELKQMLQQGKSPEWELEHMVILHDLNEDLIGIGESLNLMLDIIEENEDERESENEEDSNKILPMQRMNQHDAS